MTNKRKPNLIRRLYTMDNLPVLRCANSETADLIYLDPSFNLGRKWEDSADEKALSAANYPRVKSAINIRIES